MAIGIRLHCHVSWTGNLTISRNFFWEKLWIFRENNEILPFFQHFIFMCISENGPLPTSIITTTRKCVTVLFSVLFFGNKLTGQQWIGAGLVFAGLYFLILNFFLEKLILEWDFWWIAGLFLNIFDMVNSFEST